MDNTTSTQSNNGENKTEKWDAERFYVLLKVLNRVELYIFATGILFYFISGSISWKFDSDKAQKLKSVVELKFNPYVGQPLSNTQLRKLEGEINKSLTDDKFQPIAISNSIKSTLQNDTLYHVLAPSSASKEISDLQGISSWNRYDISSKVDSALKKDYLGLNLDQFITQGAFTSNPQIHLIMWLMLLLCIIFITNGIYYYHSIMQQKAIQQKHDELRDSAQNSKEASPVWELAQLTLNKYYSRNLSQNNWIFYVSVVVMSAGFALVLYGIALAYRSPDKPIVGIISTASGVIVQFIGGTFLVIYNSTISQAIQYTASLQKVSTVGTSIKILDGIKEGETDEMKADLDYTKLLVTARIDIAKLLIDQSKT